MSESYIQAWQSPSAELKMLVSTKDSMTYAERLTKGLLAMGWHIDHSDKSRYVAFRKTGLGEKLFVGPAGALRKGPNASNSISIGDPSRQTPFWQSIMQRGTPPEQVSLHRLAAEFGQDTDTASVAKDLAKEFNGTATGDVVVIPKASERV